ncbi:hypothetical protein L9F63_014856, partial [Diploptera punctata]
YSLFAVFSNLLCSVFTLCDDATKHFKVRPMVINRALFSQHNTADGNWQYVMRKAKEGSSFPIVTWLPDYSLSNNTMQFNWGKIKYYRFLTSHCPPSIMASYTPSMVSAEAII